MPLPIQEKNGGLVIPVKVLPRSSKNAVVGVQDNTLKVKLKAPPVGGAANKMCVQFLAKTLKIPKSCVEIISGASSRTKQVLVRPREGNSKEETAQLMNMVRNLAGE